MWICSLSALRHLFVAAFCTQLGELWAAVLYYSGLTAEFFFGGQKIYILGNWAPSQLAGIGFSMNMKETSAETGSSNKNGKKKHFEK